MKREYAVCLSGQIRTGVESAEHIMNFLKNRLINIDFFIHTWDTETVSPHALFGRNISEAYDHIPVDVEKINKIKEIYQPKLMKVDSQFDENNNLIQHYGPLLSVRECNKLKNIIEEEEGEKYELVFRIRFDQIFKPSHSIDDELSWLPADTNNHFYSCDNWGKLPSQIEDIAWYGNSETIDIASDFYLARKDSGNPFDWQRHMKMYLDEHNIIQHGWKNNSMFIYRDYHIKNNIFPNYT